MKAESSKCCLVLAFRDCLDGQLVIEQSQKNDYLSKKKKVKKKRGDEFEYEGI